MEREKKGIGQNVMKILAKKVEIPENVFTRVLLYIALCCCLQFLVVGLIGVFRGYSVQGFWSNYIMLAGFLYVIILGSRHKIILNLALFTFVYSSLFIFVQGHHERLGREYYEQGQYQEALRELKKEIQAWYLRLKYNTDEDNAMELMAKTYCQLEDFDKARDTYKLITHRYPGFRGGRAEKYIERLEDGLKVVAKYPDQLSNAKGFPSDLYEVARTYRHDLNCSRKALEVYRKIVDMDIDERWKESARGRIEKLTVVTEK